jgi:hypothetical protein
MEEENSVFYLVLAGRQASHYRAEASADKASAPVAPESKAPGPGGALGAAAVPMLPKSQTLMFSVRLKAATCQAIARAARASGKSHRQLIAGLLAGASIAVHPEDLKDRPKAQPRG